MTTTLESRNLQKLENQFKGKRIQGSPIPINKEIASAMQGDRRRNVALSALGWMNPCNKGKYAHELSNNAKRKINILNKEQREAYSAKIRQSITDREVRRELAAYREFELRAEAIGTPFALSAFQSINLSEDELPMIITPKARQYFDVYYIGQDGGARQAQWHDARSVTTHPMNTLSTDKVEVPVFDINQGDVDALANVQAQLRFDMEMEIDQAALTLIDTLKTVSGLRDLIRFHKYVRQDSVPDTNYLDLNGTDPGVFTIAKLKAILKHVVRFGVGLNIEDDMALSISSMIMAPENLEDCWDFVDLVSGWDSSAQSIIEDPMQTVLTSVREQIFNTGMMNSAWGFSWNTIPNARVPVGRLYVFMTQPVGWFFTKTAYDKLITWDGPDQQEQNYVQTVYQRVVSFVTPDLWKHRILIVDL